MLQIVLVRHGRPAIDYRTRVAGSGYGDWIRRYDEAPLDLTVPPPAGLFMRLAAVGCVATSPLRRSLESAQLLAPGLPLVCDPLFAEAGIPSTLPFSLALPPRYWTLVFRVAWSWGLSQDAESLRAARRRAQRAAMRLAELAREHGSVVLVGHGQINRLIARALRRMGWKGVGAGRAYWSVVELRRAA